MTAERTKNVHIDVGTAIPLSVLSPPRTRRRDRVSALLILGGLGALIVLLWVALVVALLYL